MESKPVKITSIDTEPEHDPYVNLAGVSSFTLLFVVPHERKAWVEQDYKKNSMLMSVYHGIDLEIRITGHPDENELREYLEQGQGQAYLREICDGHSVEWNGQNHVGSLTEDAEIARTFLTQDLADFEGKYSFWETGEWCYESAYQSVTADTTDDELNKLADEIADVARTENVVLDDSILIWLTRYREDLREGQGE